jgi:hypothetical protein
MKIQREWAMPSDETFTIEPISCLLDEEVNDGLWIDPFSGGKSLADITNDLNPEIESDYTMEAEKFLKNYDECSVDGVIFDPPYSNRQAKEMYDGIGSDEFDGKGNFWSDPIKVCRKIIDVGGKFIRFGWNSVGIGDKQNFDKKRVLMVCHGGVRNDTIVTVDKKQQHQNEIDF